MYKLHELDNDLYHLSDVNSKTLREGTLLTILTHAVYNLGFDIKELEFALMDMHDKNKDSASFGINKMFIFSFNKNERKYQ